MNWNMFRKVLLLIVGSVIGWGCLPSFSQRISGGAFNRKDYIDDFPEIVSTRLNVAQQYFGFNLKSQKQDRKEAIYRPNVQGSYGFELYYRKLGVGLSLGFPTSPREIALYGKTRFWDFQINMYGEKFNYDFNLQWYKGFYQSNPEDFDKNWNVSSGYPQLPDLRTFNIGMNAYYLFNHDKFSYQAAFVQTERQIKSAGSFLLMGSTFHTSIKSDVDLLPSSNPLEKNQGTNFRRGYFNILSVAPGYAYTFVINENFYVSPSLLWGLSLRQQAYVIDGERSFGVGIGQKINFRLAAGYYGKQFFAGFNFIWDNNRMGMENVRLSTSAVNIKLFVGYRFNRIFGKSVRIDKLDAILVKPE
jgi:hypothetical protein